jgi:hypothetical protein
MNLLHRWSLYRLALKGLPLHNILTFSPGLMEKLIFFSTGGSLLEYERKI